MAAQMITAMPHASAVVDEPAHITAGYLALTQGDLSVNREHPPLVKLAAALPLIALSPRLPGEEPGGPARTTEDFEFGYAREFLYRSNDADRLVAAARLPVVCLTLATGLALLLWGRALLGPAPAVAALALIAFEPNVLAHGRLVTTDMAATLFFLAFFACLERSQAAGAGRGWPLGAGFALGLGLLSRFSCVLMVPIAALALAIDTRRSLRARLATLGIAIAAALVLLNLAYAAAGYRGGAMIFPLAADPVGGPLRTEPLAAMEAHPLLRWTPLPIPRLYLEGVDLARHKNRHEEGPSYLDGRIDADGWWSYFVRAIAMKTTLPFIALSVTGLAWIAIAPGATRAMRVYTILPAAGLVALVSALTRAQIGLRYVLPVLPFLCLAAAAPLGRALAARRPRGAASRRARGAAIAVAVLLIAWHAAAALGIHPYHLAYFNEAAGGPSRGWRHLVDSNLDWGQDLVGLRRFMRDRGLDRINLYYFGTADPAYYGIRRAVPPEPGWFAVSATHLAGVYLPDPDYLAPFRTMPTEATIGHSILVYRLDTVPPFLTKPIRQR